MARSSGWLACLQSTICLRVPDMCLNLLKCLWRFKAGAYAMPGRGERESQQRRRRRRDTNRANGEQTTSTAFLEALEAQRQREQAGVTPSSGSSSAAAGPRELPGFRYDPERQRYFPIDSSRSASPSVPPPPPQAGSESMVGAEEPRMQKAAPQVWRGLTRGLLRRQEVGPQGMREAHALDHLTSTVLDLRSDLYFAGLARGQGDFDIQRWVHWRPQTQ